MNEQVAKGCFAGVILVWAGACDGGIFGGAPTSPGARDPNGPGQACESARLAEPGPPAALVRLAKARTVGAGAVSLPAVDTGPLPGLTRPARPTHRQARSADRITLRSLLLTAQGADPAYVAARAALERIGVPFEVHVAAETALTEDLLFEDDGTCRFSSIVLSSGSLGYRDTETDQWLSALAEDEWQLLAGYEVECGAREAIWYGYPNADVGMSNQASFGSSDRVAARLTPAGRARFPYVRADAVIDITGVWGYLGAIEDPTSTTAWLTGPGGEPLVAHHVRSDGTEVVIMTVDSGPTSLHAQLLEYGVIRWLERGLFLGERRVYLTPQMDDVYLASDLWPVGGTSADAVGDSYRMTGEDVDDLVAWQQQLQDRLPPGSSFVTHLPFNGVGRDAPEYDRDLASALDRVSHEFVWVNHTWDHADMDDMSADKARTEMAGNCQLAALHSFDHFSCSAAVTPHVSGLDNPDAVEGMLAAGVRFVVSDTSVTPEIRPDNPGTNPSHNVGRPNPSNPALFQIPRHPTNIFYNASVPAEEVDLYNFLYREWHGRDLSYQEILDADTSVGLSYLLTYDINPLMFHQANLRFWTGADGQRHSLYSDWVDRLVERYRALTDLPVISLTMPEIAQAMKQRAAYNQCGAEAVLVRGDDGDHLELTSSAACQVPVTGLHAPDAGQVQVYGDAITTFVALPGCQTLTLPL